MSVTWTVIVKMVATKGTDYLTIVAFGNSCAAFLFLLEFRHWASPRYQSVGVNREERV